MKFYFLLITMLKCDLLLSCFLANDEKNIPERIHLLCKRLVPPIELEKPIVLVLISV